jgi:hypothetical protein
VAWRSHLFAALRHPHEHRVLVLRSDRAWRLPHVFRRGRAGFANGRTLVEAFERRLQTRPWLLRQIHFIDDEVAEQREVVYELELLDREWAVPAHGRWISRGDLDLLPLADEGHREALCDYLDALERGDTPPARAAWARRGWLSDVSGWIEREVARLGHVVTGIEQIKQWSISSVLLVRTDGPDVYFKVSAPLPLFVEEGPVTAMLSSRFPGYVPAPLAVEPEQGWMLLPELGELIGWTAPLEFRRAMFERFATLQRRSADQADELIAAGCLDRRLDVLERQLEPLVTDPAAVARLRSEEVDELRRQLPVFQEACRRLADAGLPPTLVHGDLHGDNVARHDGELVYFDWTDACVAHPFIDLHSLQWEKDETSRAVLLAAYLDAWDGVATPERLLEAASLAEVVIPLHHAVSYQHIVGGIEPAARTEPRRDAPVPSRSARSRA